MRGELGQARHAAAENQAMQNEIVAMYQQLVRVDPHGHHIFGQKTQSLHDQSRGAPQQTQAPQQAPQSWMQQQQQPPQGAMQGVEYASRTYDRR